MEETNSRQPIDLREALRPIRSRLWLIIVCVAVATALTYYHYNSQPREYRATTSIYIGSTDPSQLAGSATDRETQDLATLIDSTGVQALVAQELKAKGDLAALAGVATASPSTGSDFVDVTAVSSSPVGAADLANATADAFVTNETNSVHLEATQAAQQAQSELSALPNTISNSAQRGQLQETIQQMQAIAAVPNTGMKHVDTAFPPGAAFAPNPKKNAIFAFVIALVLGIAGAYGLERLDRRLRRLADLEPLYGRPVLATVPRTTLPAPTADGVSTLPDEQREAFRTLRTAIQLAALDSSPRTIVVTSAVPREGKSTVTRNLALAYREAGLDVCVIDADLRRPSIAELLGVEGEPGLTDLVVDNAPLQSSLKQARVGVPGLRALVRLSGESEEAWTGAHSEAREISSIAVLPSGPEPANAPVVLGSDRMRALLERLRERYDIVLIDTSPLLAVSDAVPLITAADGVVVIARLGVTTRDAAEDLIGQIDRIPGANLLGVVANDVRGKDAGMRSYGYGRAYGYSGAKV